MRICEVEGCEKKHQARGMCISHYAASRFRGEFTDMRVRDGNQGCSVEDCDGEHYSRTYCRSHYDKWQRYGQPFRPEPEPKEVTFCECGKVADSARGMCRNCYNVWYHHNSVYIETPPRYKKDVVGYGSAHNRVRRERGKASMYPCVDCEQPANEWTLRAGVANTYAEDTGKYAGTRYSLNVDDYEPRCSDCHKAYDALHENRRDKTGPKGPWKYKEGAVSQ